MGKKKPESRFSNQRESTYQLWTQRYLSLVEPGYGENIFRTDDTLEDTIYYGRTILEGTEGLGEQYESNEEMKINSILPISQKIKIKARHIIFISKLAQVLLNIIDAMAKLSYTFSVVI